MSTLGVGSFLQGLLSGYKTSKEMAMQQEKLDLENAKLTAEKTKKDKEIELKQQELDMKVQEKQNKVLKDATDKLEENVIKDANYAVGYYNKTMEENELPNRKALITGQDGKEYVTDFDKDTINGHPKIQASLNNKDGMYIVKDGYIHSRNPDGGYTRTNMFGESVDNLKEAFEIKKVGTGTETIDINGVPTVVKKIDAIGKKAYYKPDKTSSGDIEGQQSILGKTIRDWEYYNKGLKASNPSKYEEEKSNFVESLFGQKAEGKVDATYKAKFDNAYNMLKKENPDMDEVELRKLADEEIRSTQGERTSKKIENMEKSIKSKFKVNNLSEINITEARKDKTNSNMLDNYFIEKAKDKLGQTWQDDVKTASTSVSNADKVFDAGNVYAQDIINGKSGINVVNRLFDNTIGSYINKNLTDEDKLNASKDLASIMNVIRNEQFGAVVPLAEQTNFNDAVTNLTKSSPDIVRGTISMLKQQRTAIKTSKDILGEELFTVKFGDKIEKLDDKISKLESSLKPKQNISSGKKPLSEIFK